MVCEHGNSHHCQSCEVKQLKYVVEEQQKDIESLKQYKKVLMKNSVVRSETIENYERAIEEFEKEYDYEHGWQIRNTEGNKRSQWHKGALAGFIHVKRIFDKNFK